MARDRRRPFPRRSQRATHSGGFRLRVGRGPGGGFGLDLAELLERLVEPSLRLRLVPPGQGRLLRRVEQGRDRPPRRGRARSSRGRASPGAPPARRSPRRSARPAAPGPSLFGPRRPGRPPRDRPEPRSRPRSPCDSTMIREPCASSIRRPLRLAAFSTCEAVQCGFGVAGQVGPKLAPGVDQPVHPLGRLAELAEVAPGVVGDAFEEPSASRAAPRRIPRRRGGRAGQRGDSWRARPLHPERERGHLPDQVAPSGRSRVSSAWSASRRSISPMSSSGTSTPEPVKPCLSPFRRERSLPSVVFGPILLIALALLAAIRASEEGMTGPFAIGVMSCCRAR